MRQNPHVRYLWGARVSNDPGLPDLAGDVVWVGEVVDQRRGDRSAAWGLKINRHGCSQPISAPVINSDKRHRYNSDSKPELVPCCWR